MTNLFILYLLDPTEKLQEMCAASNHLYDRLQLILVSAAARIGHFQGISRSTWRRTRKTATVMYKVKHLTMKTSSREVTPGSQWGGHLGNAATVEC